MSKGSKFLKGGILGALVGAVAGILFAPKAGKETRQDIKDAASKAANEAEKQLKAAHAELKELADRAQAKAKKLKGAAQKEATDVKFKADEAMAKVSETISSLRAGEADEDSVEKMLEKAQKQVDALRKKINSKK